MKKNSNKYDSSQTHLFTSFPNSQDEDEMTDLIDSQENSKNSGNLDTNQSEGQEQIKYSIWQIEYYQKYFDVNTNEVMMKVFGSVTPTFNQNFFLNRIRPNPDLYGPFWITMTLVFTIAISGNFVSFMKNFGSDFKWHTDFHKVTSSAFVIITYWWIMPTGIYALQRWRNSEEAETTFSFIELLSVYGYSLFVYIPCSILWMINISFIQWILVFAAVGLSGVCLFFTFWPSLGNGSNKQMGFLAIFLILLFNALLGLSFMLYFFHDPSDALKPSDMTTTTIESITSKLASKASRSVETINSKINVSLAV